ncbi:MAG TPA: YtxH domain-containing protein [Candidatus Limnocylindrales bacterium]|nr:YtxH domain-containing protein [Candidatus Limnocylindrales bacterium]
MKDSGVGSFLAGIAIGGLIGAAIGLLLAPAKGEEIREQVGGFVDERRAAFDEAVTEGRAAAEKARAEMLGAYDAEASSEGEATPQGGAASEGTA